MGLAIKAALGALVVLLIGVLAKTKNYYIAGLIPLFPTFALIAHYIVASERGTEALRTTIVFGMWSIIPYFLYLLSLWYFTGFLRLPGAGRGGGLLGAQRLGADFLLEPLSLAQRSPAVHGKGSAGDVTAGEQIIDKVDHLFLARGDFHQGFIQRLMTILGIIALVE